MSIVWLLRGGEVRYHKYSVVYRRLKFAIFLQQLYFFENAVGCGQAQKHDAQHDKIPVFVLKFRHIGEVHSVDAGDNGQRRCKYGKQRQFVDEFIRF